MERIKVNLSDSATAEKITSFGFAEFQVRLKIEISSVSMGSVSLFPNEAEILRDFLNEHFPKEK